MNANTTPDFADAFDILEALIERSPHWTKRFHEAAIGVDKGNWKTFSNLLAEVFHENPRGLGPLMLHAQYRSAYQDAWERTTTVFGQLMDGAAVSVEEICAAYQQGVFVLQLCDEPDVHMDAHARAVYVSWWKLIAPNLGRALVPECEARSIDPQALLVAGIDGTLAHAVAACAVVERLLIRRKSSGQKAIPPAPDKPRRLKPSVVGVGLAIEEAAQAGILPDDGSEMSEVFWKRVCARGMLKGKAGHNLDTFRRYARDYYQEAGKSRKVRVEPTRSMIRAKDEVRR